MMNKIPKFRRVDGGVDQYEAIADDGALLVVIYNRHWQLWFWRVERGGATVVAGSAPDRQEAQDRAISAWIAKF